MEPVPLQSPANAAANTAVLQRVAEENAQVAERVLVDLRSRPVVDDAGYELAAEELKEIKGEWKRIDDLRKSAVDPLSSVVKLINSWFKRPLDTLSQAEVLRKSEMTQYIVAKQAAHQKALEEASAAALAGDGSAAAAALMRVEPTAPKIPGVRQTTTYKHEVTDLAALVAHIAGVSADKVNRSLLSLLQPNDQTIAAMARTSKGTIQIPGVKVWAETGIASTSQRGAK